MSIGSGLAAQLGVSKESVYGTYVAPTEFFEFDSENLNKQPQFLSSTGLKAGHMAPPVTRHKQTVQSAGGDVTLKVPNKGFGRWLNMLHGNTVTPVQQAATTAYLQTHNIGLTSPFGKSLTCQVGKPGTSGTVQPFTYLGAKVLSVTFSCDLGGELQAVFTLDAQTETTSQSLAVASYPTALASYDFTEGNVTVGGSSVALVRSFSLTIPVAQKTDRYGLGASALKSEPISNDYMRPTMTLGLEFKDLTAYAQFTGDTSAAVVCEFVGPIIASTYHEDIKFTMAACKMVGDTPNVGGPDVLEFDGPFEVYDDGTNPPVKVEYTSIDIAAL